MLQNLAEIPLQCLIDNTSQKFLETKQVEELDTLNNSELVLHMTYGNGFDGSSSQNDFSYPFSDDSETRSGSKL